jgi:hypothetical protein
MVLLSILSKKVSETVKMLQEKIIKTLKHIVMRDNFLNSTQQISN